MNGARGRGCVNEGHILFLLDKQTRSNPMLGDRIS